MPTVIDSMELAQVLAEAEDIARNVNQKLTTAHQLLAFFTVPNRAELLLKERGIDEDRILLAITSVPKEPEGIERDLRERAHSVAEGLGASETDCLHLLIAMSRVRASAAHQLLAACGVQLSSLRNVAMSYFTASMPRRLREFQPVRATPKSPAPPPPRAAAPRTELRDHAFERNPEFTDAVPETPPELDTPPAPPLASPAPSSHRPSPTPARGRQTLSSHALDPNSFPWLSSLGRNLTELAAAGRFDPLVGRDQEIEEVIDILGKRRTNNPLLVGEPGVGKTAIVEGVAQKALASQSSSRVFVELDMASILAGTQLRGSFSEKLNGIKEEVRRAAGRVVVFIDEIHTVIGAGSTGEGPQDAANELKAALARGEFPCIGATTHDEYRRHIEKDPALERRFTPVLVREPSVTDTVSILKGIVGRYEQHHRVRYAPQALEAAAALSARYIQDRFLPDKAVAVIDLAGSRAHRRSAREVDATEVARVVARMAGVPESRLVATDRERVMSLEERLGSRVVGHAEAISRIARVLKRNYAGFAAQRPMGSFLLVGPTGVGKTELARGLADALYGTADALIRMDMSECSEATGVARLVGAAPGYVGYGDGGQLTEAVRRRPASVVILDEIEKAHRDVLMLLLQVLEEGQLTDGHGRRVDFCNAVLVLTSNLGSVEAARSSSGAIGFGAGEKERPRDERALTAARQALPLELWNRIDERIFLQHLGRSEVARIAQILLGESSKRLSSDRNIRYAAGDDVVQYLLEHGGFDATLGARPMRGAIQRLIEAPLADGILAGEFGVGDQVQVRVSEGELCFAASKRGSLPA